MILWKNIYIKSDTVFVISKYKQRKNVLSHLKWNKIRVWDTLVITLSWFINQNLSRARCSWTRRRSLNTCLVHQLKQRRCCWITTTRFSFFSFFIKSDPRRHVRWNTLNWGIGNGPTDLKHSRIVQCLQIHFYCLWAQFIMINDEQIQQELNYYSYKYYYYHNYYFFKFYFYYCINIFVVIFIILKRNLH